MRYGGQFAEDEFPSDRVSDGLKARFDQFERPQKFEDRLTYELQGRLLLRAMGPPVTRPSRFGFTHIIGVARRKFKFWRKVKSFLWAFGSFIRRGDVSIREHDRRMITCFNCVELVETTTGRFCGACGCPQSPLSDLRTKARMPGAGCPKGKW